MEEFLKQFQMETLGFFLCFFFVKQAKVFVEFMKHIPRISKSTHGGISEWIVGDISERVTEAISPNNI